MISGLGLDIRGYSHSPARAALNAVAGPTSTATMLLRFYLVSARHWQVLMCCARSATILTCWNGSRHRQMQTMANRAGDTEGQTVAIHVGSAMCQRLPGLHCCVKHRAHASPVDISCWVFARRHIRHPLGMWQHNKHAVAQRNCT